ncbi:hypothetical protein PL371_17620 [Tenacibaculum maritimum]|nr:hypothetical protein [Tenacibaculum maritimum]MDB0613652.1 hypothetical protein [Tenacibaculum maritimum]
MSTTSPLGVVIVCIGLGGKSIGVLTDFKEYKRCDMEEGTPTKGFPP